MTSDIQRIPLTVVILALNEEKNIADCLKSVCWAQDVVIVDSGSSDRTLELASRERTDVRIFRHPFIDFGDQRNWALDHCALRHEWILFLDADERITPACARNIEQVLANPGVFVGFYMCARNFFLGKWIRHVTLYPSWQLRLMKAGLVRFQKEGHGQRELSSGPLGYIREPYDHYGFSKGIEQWIDRHNRYSSDEVELIFRLRGEPLRLLDLFRGPVTRRRCLKRIAARVGFRPLLRFIYLYICRLGFLDGKAGLIYCLLRVAHEIAIVAKIEEKRIQEI